MRKGRLIGKILGIGLAFVIIGAMLPLGAFGTQSQVEGSPSATSLALLWQSEDIGSVASIAIDDVDGDGVTEIICGTVTSFDKGTYTYHGYIYIFNALTHELEWKSNDIGYVTDIVATDLDDDGNYEIVAQIYFGRSAIIGNCYGYVHVFDGASHEQRWKSSNIGAPGDLAVADLDGNCVKEIIVGGMHDYSCTRRGHVYVFDAAEFSQKWKSPDINSPSRILVADVDDDGVKEIIFGNCVTDCAYSSSEGGWYYPGYVYIFDGISFAQEWQSNDIGVAVSLIVNDVDDDGTGELIAGIHRASEPNVERDRGYIYIFDSRTHSQEWKSANIDTAYGLKVDDIDNDGTKEIAARTAQPHTAAINAGHIGHIYVFDGKTHDEEWISDNLGDAYCLGVNDVENDGVQEILTRFFHDSGWYLGIWSGETHDQEWQSTDDVGGFGGVIIPYVNEEGDREIVIGGGETEGRDYPYPDEVYHGRLYVFGQAMPSPVQITNEPGDELYPDQSEDGQYIVMTSNRDGGKGDIWRIDSNGTNFLKLTDLPDSGYYYPRYAWNPVFHPAGEYVYYMDNSPTGADFHWFLRTKTDGTGEREVILHIPGGDGGGKLSFSPDGSKFTFIYNSYDEYGTRWARRDLIIANSDGSDLETSHSRDRMRNEMGIYRDDNMRRPGIAWSPDGTRIYFKREDASGVMSLYSLNSDAMGLLRLTESSLGDCGWPAISPDGTKIAFECRESDEADYELFVMSADGSNVVQVTSNDFDDRFPTWSYDGSSIIYSSNADGDYDLYMIIVGVPSHAPLAHASDITGQPQVMYPDTEYTVTAKYFDPDGRDGLKYCYLQLEHSDKPLFMMWNETTDDFWVYAGELGENYLTLTGDSTPITEGGLEGYELAWTFTINDQWPEVENAINFGVYAWDYADLISGWDYDDSNASFIVGPPDLPPDTEITGGPSGTIDYDDVTFSWTGSDDITPTTSLVYSYCLEGYDTGWSDWTTDTSKQYSRLPNRSYIFKVKAKDLAENVDASPAERILTIDVEWSFAIITDFHIGWCNTDYGTEGWDHDTNGQDYWLTDRLNGIVEWINENEEKYNIDFVAVLGDMGDSAEYSELLKTKEVLSNLKIPYIPVIGNHDIWPYTQQEETCECPVTHMQFHCERLWRDLRVPKTWAPSAMGYEFFEEIFWEQNNQNVERIEKLFGTSWSSQVEEQGIPLENCAFTYNGVKFIALDFVDRLDDDPEERPESSGAKLHSDTRNWLTAKMKKDEPTILLSHHPIWSPAYFPIADAITVRTAISNSGADVLANFAGHIHDQDEITSSANLAGIDSILTEAVCRESIIWPLAQKGDNIRIVKIGKDEKIKGYEFGNINDEDWDYPGGKFWAWSPVDLMITDPDGFTISKETGPVTGMVYLEMDVNHDDDPEDLVILDELKIGDYDIAVIPEPSASPMDTYTLEFSRSDSRIVLAENVRISDIPSDPYTVVIKPTVTWNCPLGGQALIAPNPGAGRPDLTLPTDCTDITVSAGAQLWGIYYLVETGPDAGTWQWYIPGFTTSTLTQLEPGKLYWVVVSAPCSLTIPQ